MFKLSNFVCETESWIGMSRTVLSLFKRNHFPNGAGAGSSAPGFRAGELCDYFNRSLSFARSCLTSFGFAAVTFFVSFAADV